MTGFVVRNADAVTFVVVLVCFTVGAFLLGKARSNRREYEAGWSAGYKNHAAQVVEAAEAAEATEAAEAAARERDRANQRTQVLPVVGGRSR